MSSEVTVAYLVAMVLHGEDTFWLAEVRGKPLDDTWQTANGFWLYPVQSGITDFASVEGFHSSDSVFEVDRSGVSKLLRSAALAADVKVKRYMKDRSTYYFVPESEMQRLDMAFKMVLKREATHGVAIATAPTPPPPVAVKEEPKREEREEKAPRARAASSHNSDHSASGGSDSDFDDDDEDDSDDVPLSKRYRRAGGGSSKPSASASASTYYPGSHKRRAPHVGTTTYIAPIYNKPHGSHCSNEAFEWENYYIVHRGSADYLCPAMTGNTYGFRLDKVTHDGFPIFLLFGSSKKNSDDIEPTAKGVPAMESAVLSGEAGERSLERQVLVITRRAGEKKRIGGSSSHSSRKRSYGDLEWDSDDDDDDTSEEEEYDDDYEEEPVVRRRTQRTPAAPAAKVQPSATAAPSRSHKKKTPTVPLQCVSVNQWTDVDRAVPDAGQLSQQFPFAHDASTTELTTTVFPDGTCVTYPPAIAEKLLKKSEKHQQQKAATEGASLGGADAEMRGLLENIQLAKQLDL